MWVSVYVRVCIRTCVRTYMRVCEHISVCERQRESETDNREITKYPIYIDFF